MVHLPWTISMGNRMELDNTVNRLMVVEDQMLSIYSKKTGLDRAEIKALLEAETWMSAEEAIENGFVDSKFASEIPIAASALESKWIARRPKNYFSETTAINTAKDELKNKIRERLARK
jgi:ATP-dependent Clp protease protease subunit